MINGIKNKIVTAIYNLNYIEQRGSGLYKGQELLTRTIRNIIYDDYTYVIYTDKQTYESLNLGTLFNKPNVTIKIRELNSEYYINYLNPLRIKRVDEGEIWDRIHSVDNYIEVILNKLEFILEESKYFDGNVVWIDSGLFGTSCSNSWRDYMNIICHTKNFVDKIFEKVESNNFIALRGNHILINYVLKEKLNKLIGENIRIVPGALFGGKSEYISKYINGYKNVIEEIVQHTDSFTSEQELLSVLLFDKEVKFFDFDDWDDFQKGILKIMDIYDESTYMTNSMEKYSDIVKTSLINIPTENKKNFITKDDLGDISNLSYTQISDFYGIDKGSLHEGHMYTKVYERYLKKFGEDKVVGIEIGINDPRFPGGSLRFWDTIFPNLEFYGIDIVDCSTLEFNKEKIKTVHCDIKNHSCIEDFIKKFELSDRIDFIVDDGSHLSEDILSGFEVLYKYLKHGGYYFIEDLHAGWAEKEKTVGILKEKLENIGFSNIEEYHNKLLVITK